MNYRAYGMTVKSDVDLAPCPIVRGKRRVDVVMRKGLIQKQKKKHIHSQFYSSGKFYAHFFKASDGFEVLLNQFGRFHISQKGDEISYQFKKSLTAEEKMVGLVHHVLPLALSLKGHMILHGATIIIGGKAHLIIGDAGIGKSTLAKYFHEMGHQVFSDDAVLVKKRKGRFQVAPSVPLIRVRDGRQKKLHFVKGQKYRWVEVGSIHLPKVITSPHKDSMQKITPLLAIEKILPQVFRLDVHSVDLKLIEMAAMSDLCCARPIYLQTHRHTPQALASFRKRLVLAAKRALE